MTFRPVAARWFELVTVPTELVRVAECLSHTGLVELEAKSQTTDRLLLPALEEELKAHHELDRAYQRYWPAPAAIERRPAEHLAETLSAARSRIAGWREDADPLIAEIERLSQEAAELRELLAALRSAERPLPDLSRLAAAGPRLRALLAALPEGTMLREMPPLVLFEHWQGELADYLLVVGKAADVAQIEAELPTLKGRAIALPDWLPATREDAVSAAASRLEAVTAQHTARSEELDALSERLGIAHALGDVALVEWLVGNAREMRGSERLAWITGWTSDVTGEALRRALDACGVRYVMRLSETPGGMEPPLVLHNPPWAKSFEIFARMLGTPGRYESDPSQILAFVASTIFGFMFGDVGQGAVILLAGLILGRRYPATRILVPGGVMAIVFGFLFGSVFCSEDVIPALWLHPMEHPITMLVVAIAAGVVVISIGHVLNAVQMHWRGETRRWWAHQAGLVAAYASFVLTPLWAPAILFAPVGAAWYVLGAAALEKRHRLGAAAGAIAEFVEQTLQLLVNTVSFARVGAFALAHAGLSVAIIQMAEAAGPYAFWPILLVGNVFVMVLEGIVVSIQTTRLLLFEFFVRFLTGTGREFKPLPPPVLARGGLRKPPLKGTS